MFAGRDDFGTLWGGQSWPQPAFHPALGCGSTALYYYSLICSWGAKISCGKFRKLLRGGALRRKDGIENESAVGGDLIAMRVRKLLENAVSTEHAELAADRGGATPAFLGAGGSARKQQGL